ncbi:MAG TPA: GTP-binding protein, partial [Chromatiales bacterium]|nr:GTP-binding protein [Chromatiales bacterium]
PDVEVEVDVRGGTTREVRHYRWPLPQGGEVILADVPGILLVGDAQQPAAVEEALRAHVVVFVCDGDLTADQWRALQGLKRFNKPMILAINKVDRLRPEDLDQIRARLVERVGARAPVVAVRSGGMEEVVRVHPDGREESVLRERVPDVDELRAALQTLLVEQTGRLEALRDESVLLLAADKLAEAADAHRARTAQMLVDRYTRRAVVGGMAAMAPGTDLVIQGALAVSLTRGLCQLYGVRVREVDLDALFAEVTRSSDRRMPLLLAVAGNALKAFPGLGTLAGGAAHAVAYGLIFQSMGRALSRTLAQDGALNRRLMMDAFEEELDGDLGSRAVALAALALGQKGARGRPARRGGGV